MQKTGRVISVRGSVVDVEFAGGLPGINEAIHIDGSDGRIVVEVQQHVSRVRIRGIAMTTTENANRLFALGGEAGNDARADKCDSSTKPAI